MDVEEGFVILRGHVRKRHGCDFAEFERDLDELQAAFNAERRREQARFELLEAQLTELLRRTPDRTPVSITVTAH